MHLLWLLRDDLLDHWVLVYGHDFFEDFFGYHFWNNIFGFALGKVIVASPSRAHTEQCRLVHSCLELVLNGACAFRTIDTLLIVELFLYLLNDLLVAGGTSSGTVVRRLFG